MVHSYRGCLYMEGGPQVSKQKYAPDLTFEDVSTYVREHERSTGYQAIIMLLAGKGYGGCDMAEVRLLPVGAPASTPAQIAARGPFPTRNISRQMSCLLHLVAQAYEDLNRNPWLWTPAERAKARGEIGE